MIFCDASSFSCVVFLSACEKIPVIFVSCRIHWLTESLNTASKVGAHFTTYNVKLGNLNCAAFSGPRLKLIFFGFTLAQFLGLSFYSVTWCIRNQCGNGSEPGKQTLDTRVHESFVLQHFLFVRFVLFFVCLLFVRVFFRAKITFRNGSATFIFKLD